MRLICFAILIVLLAAIGVFALQNPEAVTIRYLDQSVRCPMALMIPWRTIILGVCCLVVVAVVLVIVFTTNRRGRRR